MYQERAFKPGISLLRRAEWMACASARKDSRSAASLRRNLVGRAHEYWSPDETKPWGALGRVYVWCQIIIGWALTFLAVAGFSGLVKTK